MGRRALTLSLLLVPAAGLAALGLMIVAAAPARPGAAGFGAPSHFAVRQAIGLAGGAALGALVARLGTRRLFAAASPIFVGALALALAVFAPGIGVRAAGARRWIHLGPLSGGPAPFLIGALALLVAAARDSRARWTTPGEAQLRQDDLPREPSKGSPTLPRWTTPGKAQLRQDDLPREPSKGSPTLPRWTTPGEAQLRPRALAGALAAVLALVIEPDFSAAAVALGVAFAALAGGGVPGRRLVPAAGLLLIALGFGATRFGYVENRIRGFRAPESDRRGKGFEVLALAHASAAGAAHGAGLGHGIARRRLSSPASDYAFAVVGEELGRGGALAVVAAWLALGAGVVLAARSPAARRDPAARALAAGLGTALGAPAALHIAVCRGWLPIIGVTMPLLSYDPALTVATGAELGILAAITLAAETRRT
jgi:cell division protein FtsW